MRRQSGETGIGEIMSEYSELIKHFEKVRTYMRRFYVYGFQSRNQLSGRAGRSGRSYDNERRRIESYLEDYMTFRWDKSGKSVFLSVDSASIPENPLYRAFKAKTFTKNDITLHFCILDLLADGRGRSAGEIAEEIDEAYLCAFDEPAVLDVSTVRKKLNEYEKIGLLTSRKESKTQRYSLNLPEKDLTKSGTLDEERVCGCGIEPEALAFFSEMSPLGVVGSYLMDAENVRNRAFCWKHHYIMPALDSEICCALLEALHSGKNAEIVIENDRYGKSSQAEILPLKFLISAQSGRRYIAAYHLKRRSISALRLDYIKSVKLLEENEQFQALRAKAEQLLTQCWGVSFGSRRQPEHLCMTLRIEPWEAFIAERIQREGRHGTLSRCDGAENTWRYEIDVWDAMEMLPWLRTFTGRVLSLTCTNPAVVSTFYSDLAALEEAYGLNEEGEGKGGKAL